MESRDNARPEIEPTLNPIDQNEMDSETTQPVSEEQTAPLVPEAQTFDELLPPGFILEGIRALGFQTPTAVQRRAIPAAREGRDLIVQSRTGSGKTIAYVLPMLEVVDRLSRAGRPNDETMALVIVPTRELAIQVQDVVGTIAANNFKPTLIIGGADFHAQEKALRADGRIVIGTPGRLLDLLRSKTLRLNSCRFFVLDEADETLSLGFLQDVRAILSRLPDKRQGLFTSATITPRVDMLANSFLEKFEHIGVDETFNDLPSVSHHYCEVGGDIMSKPNALCDLIETMRPTSAIIFCNTKSDTQLVEVLLRRRGFDARRLNSDLTQSQRNRVMQKIKQRELKFLVATDIAARGIDIEQIDTVINYAIHDQPESYLHRTGRTGRAGRSGKAISLVGPRDFGSFHYVRKIVNVEFENIPLPSDEEIAEARLAHLHEIIRQSQMDLHPRDLAIARKLTEGLGEGNAFSEELIEFIAKLCRHTLEHHVHLEAKSLDEELAATAATAAENQGEERPRRNQSRRDDDRGRRGGGDRQRRDDRERPSDSRHGSQESRGQNGDNRDRPREPRGQNRDSDRPQETRAPNRDSERPQETRGQNRDSERPRQERAPRREEPRRQPPVTTEETPAPRRVVEDFSGEDVRLYVGQGTSHGMTEKLFRELASEFGEIDQRDLKSVWFREEFGFADVAGERVNSVLENLSGIEYNGFVLPVEIATTVRRNNGYQNRGPRRDSGYGNQNEHRRNDRRGNDRRYDDRRGNQRQDRRGR